MKKTFFLTTLVALSIVKPAFSEVSLNIYNNDLALVKDTREIKLTQGRQRVYFDGVSANLKPESAFVLGDNIKVIEKNYDYNLINQENLLKQNVGKTIKTAITNPQTGKDIIKKAKVISANYGTPVLEFDYGVETNFNGRLIFDNIPAGLSAKPTFQLVLEAQRPETKRLELLYLTSNISWKTDYIADIHDNTIELSAWVSITNNSGVDYNDARIKVVAGEISQVSSAQPRLMAMAKGMNAEMSFSDSFSSNTAKPVGDYYFYELDQKTTIKDNQTKQMFLFGKKDVAFTKQYDFASPLYFGINANKSDFQKLNPQIVFNIKNDDKSNLNILLPAGIVRFYEETSTFLGEALLSQTAKGEDIKLVVGKTSDIYAKGKITNINKISKDTQEVSAEITIHNSKDISQKVFFEQNIRGDWSVIEESHKSSKKNASTAVWGVNIKPNSNTVLKYKVRIKQ